jgi:hypothetical protein
MSYSSDSDILVTEQRLNDAAVNSFLDAYSDHAYQQGYARATRDLLAVYPLLIEQYLHANQIESPELRRALRGVGEYIEQTVDRKLSDNGFANDGGFVNGGLGI